MSEVYESKARSGLEQLGFSVAQAQRELVAQQSAAANWSYTHFLGTLLDGELSERHRKRVELNLTFDQVQASLLFQVICNRYQRT